MRKPLGLGLIVGLLALAFAALPAMASATITAENTSGKHLDGAGVLAVSNDLTTETNLGTLECEETVLSGTFQENVTEEEEIEVAIEEGSASGGGVGTRCPTSTEGIEAEIDDITVDPFVFFSDGTDLAEATFVVTLFVAGMPGPTCHYEGIVETEFEFNVPLVGPTNDKVLPSVLTQTAAGCPLGNGILQGSFDITSGGLPVVISQP